MCNSSSFNQEVLKCTLFELRKCVCTIIQLLRSEVNTCPVGERLINKVHNLKSQLSGLSEDLIRQCKCLQTSSQCSGSCLGAMGNVDLTEVLGEIKKCMKQETCEFSFSPTSMTDAPGVCLKRDDFNPQNVGCQKPGGCGCGNCQVNKGGTNLCDNEGTCPLFHASDKTAESEMFGQFYDVGAPMTFGNPAEDFEGDIDRVLTLLNELKDILATGNYSGGKNFGPQALELIKSLESLVNGDSVGNGNDYLVQNFPAELLSDEFEGLEGNKTCTDLNTRFKDMICRLYSEFESLEDEVKEKAISDLAKMREALMTCEPKKGETEDSPYDEDGNRGQQEGPSNSDPNECQDGTREDEQTGENAETDPSDRGTHNTVQRPSVENNEGNANNLKDDSSSTPLKKEEVILSDASNNSVMESQRNCPSTADIREKITSLLRKRDSLTSAEFDRKLLSVVGDLDDILDTFDSRLTTTSGQPPPPCIKPTASLFWVISCLENFIRRIEPNLHFPECNLESKVCSLLCVFSYLLQSQRPDLSNLGMAEEALKCLDIELSRQGTRASVLAAYAHQLEEKVVNTRTVKTDTKTEEGNESGPKNCLEFENTNQTQRNGLTDDEDVGEEAQSALPNDLVGRSQTTSPLTGEVKCEGVSDEANAQQQSLQC